MCGIIGFYFRNNSYQSAELSSSVNSLLHRGPDGCDQVSLGRIGLGHTRLSIIDLTDDARQPMSSPNGKIYVTFNGEIYNYRALRDQLLDKGYTFRSQSDTEVLVRGYEEWGIGLLDKLEGMFAFAIWDENKQELFLARDRFGIKPLYYYHSNDSFIFGSELKALYEFSDFKKEIDYSSLIDYFHYYVIPGQKTIWKNTYKLLPAQYLILKSDFSVKKELYWEIRPGVQSVSADRAVEIVNELLTQATRKHLESDVPVGVFLSSGYDSSSLVAYTKKFKENINTFSVGFKDSQKTEHVEAAMLAKYFGTTHTELVLDEDYMDVLGNLFDYYDEPFAVTSMVSYYYVSKLAAQTHKVVFAGDGGDEVFAGYKWYDKIEKAHASRSLISKLFRSDVRHLRNFYLQHYYNEMGIGQSLVNEIIDPDLLLSKERSDIFSPFELSSDQLKLHPVKVFQLLDFKYFIPDVALPRADRSSMASSLEVRVPFLDHKLVEYMIDLDVDVYRKRDKKKFLLYENIKGVVPKSILDLPKKGFGNPLEPFFAKRNEHIDRLSAGKVLSSSVLNGKLDLKKLNKRQLWLLYCLELWWSKWN